MLHRAARASKHMGRRPTMRIPWLALVAASTAQQRTLILTSKALETIEAARDLGQQRRH